MMAMRALWRIGVVVAVVVGLSTFSAPTPVAAYTATGGGYTLTDVEESSGPPLAWDDPSSGTSLSFSSPDDATTSVSIPFSFSLFGSSYTSVFVSTNGLLNFGTSGSAIYSNTSLPSASAPTNAIFAFWDDLYMYGSAMVKYQTFGTAPNRRFVVSWISISRIGVSGSAFTFQVALFEGSNAIRIQYQSLTNGGSTTDYASGIQATTGIQGSVTTALQYHYGDGSAVTPTGNTTYSGLTIGFVPTGVTPPWASAPPPPPPPPSTTPAGGTTTVIHQSDKGRTHKLCGGSAAAAMNLSWLAIAMGAVLALAVGSRKR